MIDNIERSQAGIDSRIDRTRVAGVEAADRTWSDARRLILALVIGALVVVAAVLLASRSAFLTHGEIDASRLENARLRARQEALLERMSDLRGQLEVLGAETAPNVSFEVGGKEGLGKTRRELGKVVEHREEVILEQEVTK